MIIRGLTQNEYIKINVWLCRKSGIIFASFLVFISTADRGLAPSGVSANSEGSASEPDAV